MVIFLSAECGKYFSLSYECSRLAMSARQVHRACCNSNKHCDNKSEYSAPLKLKSALEDKFEPNAFPRLPNITTCFNKIHHKFTFP